MPWAFVWRSGRAAQQGRGGLFVRRVTCPSGPFSIRPAPPLPRLALTPASSAPSLLGLQGCSTVMSISSRFLTDFAAVLTHPRCRKKKVFPVDICISQWDKNPQLSGGILRLSGELELSFSLLSELFPR